MTPAQLAKAAGCSVAMSVKWVLPLSKGMDKFNISTPARQAAFIAQVAHESGRLEHVEENLNYSATALLRTFPTHFSPADAARYERKPQAIANRVYANRMGNKTEISGDGWQYRGRGLIQITGLDNYKSCGIATGLSLVANPDLLLQPEAAALSAAWFWSAHGCNELADRDDFAGITKRINGGLNGQADRLALFAQASEIFA
jgi:putative chitinase